MSKFGGLKERATWKRRWPRQMCTGRARYEETGHEEFGRDWVGQTESGWQEGSGGADLAVAWAGRVVGAGMCRVRG